MTWNFTYDEDEYTYEGARGTGMYFYLRVRTYASFCSSYLAVWVYYFIIYVMLYNSRFVIRYDIIISFSFLFFFFNRITDDGGCNKYDEVIFLLVVVSLVCGRFRTYAGLSLFFVVSFFEFYCVYAWD